MDGESAIAERRERASHVSRTRKLDATMVTRQLNTVKAMRMPKSRQRSSNAARKYRLAARLEVWANSGDSVGRGTASAAHKIRKASRTDLRPSLRAMESGQRGLSDEVVARAEVARVRG